MSVPPLSPPLTPPHHPQPSFSPPTCLFSSRTRCPLSASYVLNNTLILILAILIFFPSNAITIFLQMNTIYIISLLLFTLYVLIISERCIYIYITSILSPFHVTVCVTPLQHPLLHPNPPLFTTAGVVMATVPYSSPIPPFP